MGSRGVGKATSSRAGTLPPDFEKNFSTGTRVVLGLALGLLLVVGAGGWAATTPLTGAVIAQGSVIVDQNLKAIQHRDGGIVSDILVREGDFVTAGQVLIRLEDAQTKAERSIARWQLLEYTARRARLLAERDDLDAIELPMALQTGQSDVGSILQGEIRLFEGNLKNRESQKQQLNLGIEQIGEEVIGLEAQRRSKDDEIALLDIEYKKLKGLAEKRLIEGSRVYTSDRDRARLLGERGEVDAAIARARTRIGEIRLQIIAIDENARTEAQRELSLVETKIAELQDRLTAIEDQLSRTDIRAPIAGTVNELNIHTIGGVITPAEVLVTIVPKDARLKIEVRLAPASIDQVSVGRPARLRFTAFNQRTTPELKGAVVHVSPATNMDSATGEIFYVGEIEIPPEELAKIDKSRILPGMPVEVYVSTDERTAMSYMVKPLMDQFSRAFRER